jgi:hypothetical protein
MLKAFFQLLLLAAAAAAAARVAAGHYSEVPPVRRRCTAPRWTSEAPVLEVTGAPANMTLEQYVGKGLTPIYLTRWTTSCQGKIWRRRRVAEIP